MEAGNCAVCKKNASYYLAHAGISYCPAHFAHYVEKKIKHGARETSIFGSAKRLGFLLGGDVRSLAVLSVMGEIAKGQKAELIILEWNTETPLSLSKKAKRLKLEKVITGHTIEDFVVRMLVLASEKKPEKLLKLEPKTGLFGEVTGMMFPAPAFRVYRKELEEYARLKGITGKENSEQSALEQDLLAFIERLEAEHPGTKHKMLKSLLYFSGKSTF
ncbi:MAG: hypothetical protein ABIF01_02050 [Candidatus Micrarchaeota archaeon]